VWKKLKAELDIDSIIDAAAEVPCNALNIGKERLFIRYATLSESNTCGSSMFISKRVCRQTLFSYAYVPIKENEMRNVEACWSGA